MTSALEQLKTRLSELTSLNEARAVLDWDMQTQMPSGGAQARARQVAILTRLAHEMFTADETRVLLERAAAELQGANPRSDDVNLVRVSRRDYEQNSKLPAKLVTELSQTTSLAHEIWAKARTENNFKAFAPTLEKIVNLTIEKAHYLGYTDHVYDALLDTYEPGMKTADVQRIFADLRKDLIGLVQAISARQDRVSDAVLHQPYDEGKQRAFAEMVIQQFGYDFNRGRQDRAVHPFCTSFSRDDVRITTRFNPKWLNPALFGTLHETGHALYEQGVGAALADNALGSGVSLGVHESQSRLWENIVGRSRGFWSHFYPQLQATFPDQLGKVDLDAFYRAINSVKPSLIRVEADEVTYNLHIMVRLELEIDLVSQKLKVSDLPEAWNAKYKDYLGIVPPTDSDGVLQDIHWSGGLIGYFSTYSLGNLLSVQLYDTAVRAYPSIPQEIGRGKFDTLLNWLRENIHQHGRKFDPPDLIVRATGEPLQARSYMAYLRSKYSEIYGL